MQISAPMEKARNDLVTCVIDHTEESLMRAGLEPEKATSIAVGLADELVNLFGGQNITFPKEYARKKAQKEASIYAEFKAGASYRDLAATHDMTERGVRKLVDRVRSRLVQSAKV